MILINPVGEKTRYKEDNIFNLFKNSEIEYIFITNERIIIKSNNMKYYILNPTKKVLNYFQELKKLKGGLN